MSRRRLLMLLVEGSVWPVGICSVCVMWHRRRSARLHGGWAEDTSSWRHCVRRRCSSSSAVGLINAEVTTRVHLSMFSASPAPSPSLPPSLSFCLCLWPALSSPQLPIHFPAPRTAARPPPWPAWILHPVRSSPARFRVATSRSAGRDDKLSRVQTDPTNDASLPTGRETLWQLGHSRRCDATVTTRPVIEPALRWGQWMFHCHGRFHPPTEKSFPHPSSLVINSDDVEPHRRLLSANHGDLSRLQSTQLSGWKTLQWKHSRNETKRPTPGGITGWVGLGS